MAVKVNRSEIPLLVIGLGGTGKDSALAIKRKFQERFSELDPNTKVPPRTAFLVLDDDNAGIGVEPEGLVLADYHRLHVNNIGGIFTSQTFTSYEREWINPGLSTIAATDGAGGVRQLGRFQLFRNIDEVVNKLKAKLNAILAHSPTTPPSAASMNVLICSSLSGGTGSGTALDMAYIVRQIIQSEHAAYASGMKMYGMFVMPENIIKKAALDSTRVEELQANTYAAMKEIDYWMRQPHHRQSITVEYSGTFKAEWNHQPFNYLCYIGHSWESGVAITNPYPEAINKITELMLLLSAETPREVNGELIPHNIYSNLSNADNQMATLQGVAPYPVSINAMSLGMSEYSSDEIGVADYEKEKTLELVMKVPTYNVKTHQEMSAEDAELTGSELVDGILSFDENVESFFDNLIVGVTSVNDFKAEQGSPILDCSNKKALLATGQSYAQQILNHYMGIFPTTRDYYKDYFDKVWANFVEEAKKSIRDVRCGPVGFLHFLDQIYLPDLDGAYADSTDIVKNSPVIIDERVMACDSAYQEALKTHIGLPGTTQEFLNNYQARTDELCDACWDQCIHRAKVEILKNYRNKVKSYRDNLEMLIEALKLRIVDCERKEVNAELVGGDLNFAQLKAYLDGSIADPDMVKGRDESIAKARDAVLERIADDSFRLPREKVADTYSKQEELKNEFLGMVNEFVENAFADIGLGNLDVVLEAASQIVGEDKIKYMANTVAPRMAAAAKPMLQLKTNYRTTVKSFCNFHHTSVPRDAQAIQEGLKIYNNAGVGGTDRKADFTVSDITDRMIHLHMKLGIPMYLMSDVYKLRENYERVLSRTGSDPCLGIHLVNKVKSFNGLKSGKTYTLRQTWLKLPSPIPPVEIEKNEMSAAEKGSVEYLEDLLGKAVQSGIVTFSTISGDEPYDGTGINADLSNEILQINSLRINDSKDAVNTMHVDDIKAVIDQVFSDENQTEEQRLNILRGMREDNIRIQLPPYGNYLQNYASALSVMPIVPIGGESPTEREKIAANYLFVRNKLCAWMLSMFPESLCMVEKNLDAFSYLYEKEQILQSRIDRKNRIYEKAGKFALLWAADKFRLDVTTFRVDNYGTPYDLFDNDLDLFSAKDLKYWEAAFMLQYEEHEKDFPLPVSQLIDEYVKKYPANYRALRDSGSFADVEAKLAGCKAQWEEKLADIRSNLSLQNREQMSRIYEALIHNIDIVLQSYELARGSTTELKPTPVPIAAEPVKPEPKAEPAAEKTAGNVQFTAFPQQYIDYVAALSHEARIALLKQLPEDRRMVLIGQLPADQMVAALNEV